MQKQQYKRIYNVVFVLLLLSTFFFVFKAAETFIETNVIDTQKEQYQEMHRRQANFIFNQLVKAGKRKEAEEFRRDRMANVLGILMTDDENGELFGTKANSLNRRIQFCEENRSFLSVIATLLAYTAAYFFVWYAASCCTRYVKGADAQTPKGSA